MRRKLFSLAAAISLVLCLVTIALWGMFSYRPIYSRSKDSVGPLIVREHFFTAQDGRIQGFFQRNCDKSRPPSLAHQVGFPGLNFMWGAGNGNFRAFDLEFPLALVICGVMPLIWLIDWGMRYRTHVRATRGNLCPTCGYDLRATPDRCPECGTPQTPR